MAHLPDNAPFVLLDDARAAGAAPARLYRDPVSVVQADSAEDVEDALAEVADAQARGLHAAGFITFEAGYALEPKLAGKAYGNADPLLWFGQFDRYDEIAPEDVPALLPQPQSGWLGVPEPHITRADYTQAFARVQVLIEAGDIYQANLTYPADVACAGHPLSLYAGLRMRANAPYGGIIFTGSNWLLSASPELFFTLHNGKLIAKPMKGTAARTGDDASEIEALLDDPKQRAENLMIVDLLRNDLSRVAEAGSVKVPALFDVETYRHVHQMTSTVAARLRADLSATDVLRTLFPCGSVTGAPKIRAMEVIAEVERTARGAYTGSIGRIDANGDAVFNVAIRTLALQNGANKAVLGLGSGIVADSMESDEWAECAVKGAFVMSPVAFDLIETMRFDPDAGITLLEGHLARMKASAAQFGFPFNRHDVRNALQAATIRHAGLRRLRLRLGKSGAVSIEIGPMPETPMGVVDLAIAPLPVRSDDVRLAHKTSDRGFYDDARRACGAFEMIFTDPKGFLTEGSFSNIFVARNGVLLTPPLSRGMLPGVFRAALIERGEAREGDLRVEDLSQGFFIGNALRGLLPARLKSL